MKPLECFKAIRTLEGQFLIEGVEILRASNSRLYVTSIKKQIALIIFNLFFASKFNKSLREEKDNHDFIYLSSSNVLKKQHTKEMEELLLTYLDEYSYVQFRSRDKLSLSDFVVKVSLAFKYFRAINLITK